MSSFDPSSFEDIAALANIQKQKEQLKVAVAQARELARLNETAQEEAERRNLIYRLKKASEQIDRLLKAGSFHQAHALMRSAKTSFFESNLKQEDFSTLEFKNLADDLSGFYANIETHLAGVVPPEIMNQILEEEDHRQKQEADRKRIQQAEREEAFNQMNFSRRQTESGKVASQVKVIGTAVFLVFILYLLFLSRR